MKIQTTIEKWNNSLALRLSGPMAAIPHFEADMLVEVKISGGGIQVHPVAGCKQMRLPFSEADLLKGLTAKSAHVDEIVTFGQ